VKISAKIGAIEMTIKHLDSDQTTAPETTPTPQSAAAAKPSDFRLEDLRLDQSFDETAKSERILIHVPVETPSAQRWIRVHPEPAYRWQDMAMLSMKDEGEHYLLHPSVARAISEDEWRRVTIYVVVDRQGQVSLWPIPQPPAEGKDNMWHKTARECAELAMTKWIRVKRERKIGYVPYHKPNLVIPDPDLAALPPGQQLVDIAFKDGMFIKDLTHPILEDLL
jgi:hypothetical protein